MSPPKAKIKTAAAPAAPTSAPELFFDREMSWLAFNRRVLHQAADARTPLLERLAFLAIFSSNLDEFFQKRVGGLKQQIDAGVPGTDIVPGGPAAQLAAIRAEVLSQLAEQAQIFAEVKTQLRAEGIAFLSWEELEAGEQARATAVFMSEFFPVLTPLSVDPGHPFPFISNLSTSLGVVLHHAVKTDDAGEEPLFARVKVPRVLPAFLRVDDGRDARVHRFISAEDLIRRHLPALFEGMEVREVLPFRLTRSATVEHDVDDDDEAEDLLESVSLELRERKFASAVRMEVMLDAGHPMHRFITDEVELEFDDIYPAIPGLIDPTTLWSIHASCNRPDLKYAPFAPLVPPHFADGEDIFACLRAGDLFVHHPYDSFEATVVRFIASAARDPQVLAIKMTLYRAGDQSPFISELIRAAESGKQVVVLVELKARFDEERNMQIAKRLEKHGVHVVYGMVGLKTHTKTALVVRKEQGGVRCYAHIGTGNYNPKTARLYTDFGLFTCHPDITGDLVELFHYLTGRSAQRHFSHLLVAPLNMRQRFVEMIDREISHAKAWKSRGAAADDPLRPRITAKMNQLEDRKICRKLYEASQAGVAVDLIVRGFCSLRPGVPGLSENIRVVSIIGRLLEHSRIYRFSNAGKPEYFIGSSDWMYRNLDARVECVAPVRDQAHRAQLDGILELMLADRRQAWDLAADGTWTLRSAEGLAADAPEAVGTQEVLLRRGR